MTGIARSDKSHKARPGPQITGGRAWSGAVLRAAANLSDRPSYARPPDNLPAGGAMAFGTLRHTGPRSKTTRSASFYQHPFLIRTNPMSNLRRQRRLPGFSLILINRSELHAHIRLSEHCLRAGKNGLRTK